MVTKKAQEKGENLRITISAPAFKTLAFKIVGTAPLVMNRFGAKALQEMHDRHEEGDQAAKAKKKKKPPKDFQALYRDAMHISREGWHGFPAPAIRAACIRVCTLDGYHMTLARMSVFCEADGYDVEEGTPLVRLTKGGEPEYLESYVRLKGKTHDLRPRPMFPAGWEAIIRIRFDSDQFTAADIANMLMRVGMQAGICEGRPSSPSSNGMGWGLFRIDGAGEILEDELATVGDEAGVA